MIQTRTAHSTSTENGSLQPPTRGASKPKANGQSSSFLRSPSASSSQSPAASTWSHTPTTVTLLWLVFSLPLVVWDFIYCLGRPWTMPGGSWHWPLYVPYELYGKIDYIYGWPAFDQRNGFTSAQAVLNVAETAMYAYYLYIYCASARGAEGKWWQAGRRIEGRLGGFAALLGLSAAVMTCSKTVLYCELPPPLSLLGYPDIRFKISAPLAYGKKETS